MNLVSHTLFALVLYSLLVSGVTLQKIQTHFQPTVLHGVFWLTQTEAKKYQDKEGNFLDSLVPELIDKWISCSLTNKDEKLNKLVKEVNIHKSTKSCQKVNNPCRFSFPRLPSDKTLISNPLSEEDLSKKAYNLISTTLSEEELSKEIINLIYYPSSEKDLGKDVFTEKLNDAKNIL